MYCTSDGVCVCVCQCGTVLSNLPKCTGKGNVISAPNRKKRIVRSGCKVRERRMGLKARSVVGCVSRNKDGRK